MKTLTRFELAAAMLAGSELRDETYFEQGMCSNGGHYGVTFRLRDDPEHYVVLRSISDYEDADPEAEAYGVSGLWTWIARERFTGTGVYTGLPAWTLDGQEFRLAEAETDEAIRRVRRRVEDRLRKGSAGEVLETAYRLGVSLSQ